MHAQAEVGLQQIGDFFLERGHVLGAQFGCFHVRLSCLSASGADFPSRPPKSRPKSRRACDSRITATGAPALTYQWRVNGTNIPPATNASG